MVMGTETRREVRLSEIIGAGKNFSVQFNVEKKDNAEVPQLDILLTDLMLAQIPLNNGSKRSSCYTCVAGNEKLYYYPKKQTVEVVTAYGQVVAQQTLV